ncbi:Hpt domain-containing protein [Maridesulfovibrio sp.]|uniref:Hpt domain-containing protein n=1 Tax=Maridesulfovibrio sp. TaxID=2795000 RepID=UPI002A18A604|nr:Hpt domain-containing protein [Maridesulfovibrio sp.]
MGFELRNTVENHLLEKAGLPQEKLDEFITESAAHLRRLMSVLDDAIDDGDFEEIISNAHRLRGGLCNLGLEELSMVAKNIETTAAGNAPAHLSCYFMRLRRELKPLIG